MFRRNYIGVDIGSGRTILFYKEKLYEIATSQNSIDSGDITDPEPILQALKSLVSENKLKGKKAVISYNGPSIFTKIIELPIMNESEIENYLKLEMESLVPFPVEEDSLDYIELSKDQGSMEILIIAIKKDLALPYIQVVKEAGLLPYAMDIPALAIAREIFKEKEQGLQLIIDFGTGSTDIHIYLDSVFRFSRSIRIAGKELENFNDFQMELERSIDYFRYGYGNRDFTQFTAAYLIGGNKSIDGLKEIVGGVVGLEPTILEDSKGVLAKGLSLWRDKA